MKLARLEGEVDRAGLADRRFGEPVADQLRAEHLLDAGKARRGFVPVGQVLVRDPAQLPDLLTVGVMLGSAEQKIALLAHQKIGVHHQIGQVVRQGMLRRRPPEVGVICSMACSFGIFESSQDGTARRSA
jgi:hypothetical protein